MSNPMPTVKKQLVFSGDEQVQLVQRFDALILVQRGRGEFTAAIRDLMREAIAKATPPQTG